MAELQALTQAILRLEKKLDALTPKSEFKDCVNEMKNNINNHEQYMRCWAIRIVGLCVPDSLVKELGVDVACMLTTYDKIIKPVLSRVLQEQQAGEKAKQLNLPSEVPPVFALLSNAHFVGRSVANKEKGKPPLPPAIIVRFVSKVYRNIFLRNKKRFMPCPTMAEKTAGVKYYTATPDLTKAHFSFLKSLRNDPRVFAAWSQDVNIKYKLAESGRVHQTSNVFQSIDELVATATSSSGDSEEHKIGNPGVTRSQVRKSSPSPQHSNRPINSRKSPESATRETTSPAQPKRSKPSRRGGGKRQGSPTPPLLQSTQLPNASDRQKNQFPPEFLTSENED